MTLDISIFYLLQDDYIYYRLILTAFPPRAASGKGSDAGARSRQLTRVLSAMAAIVSQAIVIGYSYRFQAIAIFSVKAIFLIAMSM
jgi:hypothetical protein